MSDTFNTCTKGSDDTCTKISDTMCCAFISVTAVAATPTDAQKAVIAIESAAKWPTAKGDEFYFCQVTATLAAQEKANGSTSWDSPADGATYTLYCAGAQKMLVGAAAFASMALATSF